MTTKTQDRIILDTNLLVSRLLTPSSAIAISVRLIIDHCKLLVSQATMDELVQVLSRIERKSYINQGDINHFVAAYMDITKWVPIIKHVTICRDPKDDKFLDLAINANADYLITGDKDLLVLESIENTQILTTTDFINKRLS